MISLDEDVLDEMFSELDAVKKQAELWLEKYYVLSKTRLSLSEDESWHFVSPKKRVREAFQEM